MEMMSAEQMLRERTDIHPLMVAACLVEEKRVELMKEQRRISSPACRLLRRVTDYLDDQHDIETMDWPEEIRG